MKRLKFTLSPSKLSTMNKLLLVIIIFASFLISCSSNSLPIKDRISTQGLDVKKYIGLDKPEYSYLTGKNVTIAIIDSGIDTNENIRGERVLTFVDFVNGKFYPYDDHGHGNFVSNIISGDGRLQGMAPDANLIILKVLNADGEADSETFINSLKWLNENINKYGIKVVNISFGIHNLDKKSMELVNELIAKITMKDVLLITSSGNSGPADRTILIPGDNNSVVTVGSINTNNTYDLKDDTITNFSSRDNSLSKPDLYTFGIDVTSISSERLGIEMDSGSSYSAAIVSGVVALLIEKYSNEEGKKVKEILFENTSWINGDRVLYFH